MATNTFERKIELANVESVKKLMTIMSKDAPISPLSNHPFSKTERDRSEGLLKQCSLRSPR